MESLPSGLTRGAWHLAIDRTNWKFGKTHVNILVVAVIWKGVGIPLIWKVLPAAGNSDTETRICLLQELFKVFPNLKIASLTGDREFIGDEWFRWLLDHKIPFVLRLRENQYVVRQGYETWSIADIAQSLKTCLSCQARGRCLWA
jgi:Transposase DDE domain